MRDCWMGRITGVRDCFALATRQLAVTCRSYLYMLKQNKHKLIERSNSSSVQTCLDRRFNSIVGPAMLSLTMDGLLLFIRDTVITVHCSLVQSHCEWKTTV